MLAVLGNMIWLSFQEIESFDVSLRIWFPVRHVTNALVFDGYRWIKMKRFILFRHCLVVVPKPGQLLYVRQTR